MYFYRWGRPKSARAQSLRKELLHTQIKNTATDRQTHRHTDRAGKNMNRCFLKVEKNMFITPVFYLGAERNRFTIALQYRSCELVNLFPRGLPGKPGLIGILVARGCLKHLFLSESSQTTLLTLFFYLG
jgi:hypothetical protein